MQFSWGWLGKSERRKKLKNYFCHPKNLFWFFLTVYEDAKVVSGCTSPLPPPHPPFLPSGLNNEFLMMFIIYIVMEEAVGGGGGGEKKKKNFVMYEIQDVECRDINI